MLDNLFHRLSLWWGHVIETLATWNWKRKRQRYENLEPSDD